MAKYEEGQWITIRGRHVLVGADGVPQFNESVKEKQLARAEAERKVRNEKDPKATADLGTQQRHKKAVEELNSDKYEDGTYDIDSKKTKDFTSGYQVTFCQIGDNYSDAEYANKVNECLKMSSDGKTYAGKFEGTPEISFHFANQKQAEDYARANNQISIWDWKNMLPIDTGGTGKRKK